ncbi:MAG TPA: hypothetical protein VH040_13955 [Usitatibacter sp.]|jgi:hypothetical protein|nr:hypothetical protein [Usitatibacter sp.]
MEDTKKQEAGQELSTEQATEVSGGAGSTCGSTATVGTGGVNVQTTAPSPGDAMTAIYDGLVDTASHVIETVAHAAK